MNQFGTGWPDNATTQISKPWALWFYGLVEDFKSFHFLENIISSCDLDIQQTWDKCTFFIDLHAMNNQGNFYQIWPSGFSGYNAWNNCWWQKTAAR